MHQCLRRGIENGDCDALDELKAKLAAKLHAPVWPPSWEDGSLCVQLFGLGRTTVLPRALRQQGGATPHVPCYHAEKLKNQLQAKQQAVQSPGVTVFCVHFSTKGCSLYVGKQVRSQLLRC